MGRKNRRAPAPQPRSAPTAPAAVEYADGGWHVRRITGAAASKSYLCPGCNQQIPVGTPHLVAWSADNMLGADFRRHWHTPCWERRFQRH